MSIMAGQKKLTPPEGCGRRQRAGRNMVMKARFGATGVGGKIAKV
jgi:hypothetical protein